MMRAMLAAISGLHANQTMLDTTASDIANVNTVGFKSQRVTFEDAFAQTLQAGVAPTTTAGGTAPEQMGIGVRTSSIDSVMSAGAIQSTGNPTDLAVQGNGWFRVSSDGTNFGAGSISYTRAGNFNRDANGDLVTPDGQYLVGSSAANGQGNPDLTCLACCGRS